MDSRDRPGSRVVSDGKRSAQSRLTPVTPKQPPTPSSKPSPAKPTRPRSLTTKPPPPPPLTSHRRTASSVTASTTSREQNPPTPGPRTAARRDASLVPAIPPKPQKLLADRARIRESIAARNLSVKAAVEKKTNAQNTDALKLSRKGTPAVNTGIGPPPTPAAQRFQQALLERSNQPRIHRRHTSSVTPTTTSPREPPQNLQLPTPTSEANANNNLSPHQSRARPSTSHAPSPTSPRSESRRRSPARFSSNGVATSTGPPPSLAYRRRLSMDNRGSYSSGPSSQDAPGHRGSSASSSTVSALPLSRTGSRQGGRDSSMDADNSGYYPDDDYDDGYGEKDRTIRGIEDIRNGSAIADGDAGQDGEDVFLRLARTNSVTSRVEKIDNRRRARLSQYAQRNSLPPDIMSSPLAQTQTHEMNSSPPQATEEAWRRNAHMSTPIDGYRARRISNASEYTLDRATVTPRQPYPRPMSMLRREGSRSPASHSRSMSMAEPVARPRTNLVASRTLHSSAGIEDGQHSPMIEQDYPSSAAPSNAGGGSNGAADSASTVSTTAASSVWDELDDLKSRIRRLEITGRMPASGAGAASNSSGDRPRTATTTVTTVSSSPRRGETGVSPTTSTFTGAPSMSHPLLNAALSKAKPMIAPEIFKHLELASKDALSLADTVGAASTGASSSVGTDRLARRKVDSMCRSLTELCIALTENRHSLAPGVNTHVTHLQPHYSSSSRPVSRDRTTATGRESILGGRESILGGRESILGGRESILGGGRVSVLGNRDGRFAERKHSIVSLSASAGYSSPRGHHMEDSLPSPINSSGGTVRQRNSMNLNLAREDMDDRDRFRAPSRAATEILTHHRLPAAREYSLPERPALERSTTVRRHYPVNTTIHSSPTVHSSPSIQNTGRRFFSGTMDHRDRADLGMSGVNLERQIQRESGTFDHIGGAPVNERLIAAVESDQRYRSGSLGRVNGRRTIRGLRESVDFDNDSGGGVPFNQSQVAATERLLNRR
ncbi:hypothetical protein EDC01DRAFT_627189 [Geopyxis carbonaria]|nr:hypothetical protein EDC01DRAFT_627189 [Geopyxis carbonaria]